MANFFDAPDQSGKQIPGGNDPSVPTLGTPYGTPGGTPDPNFASGSPYFDLGGTLAKDAPYPNATAGWGPTGPPSTTSGDNFWDAPASSTTAGAQGLDWGSLLSTFPGGGFSAPNIESDPGYQARLAAGEKGVSRSAAAKGTLLTGGTLKDLSQFDQDYASNEYNNAYEHALQAYQQSYNQWSNDQNNIWNRLYQTAVLGSNAAGAQNALGSNFGSTIAGLQSGYGQDLAGLLTGQANANAAGSVAQGNIGSGLASGLGNGAMDAYLASIYGKTGTNFKPPANTPLGVAAGDQSPNYNPNPGISTGTLGSSTSFGK